MGATAQFDRTGHSVLAGAGSPIDNDAHLVAVLLAEQCIARRRPRSSIGIRRVVPGNSAARSRCHSSTRSIASAETGLEVGEVEAQAVGSHQ